MAINSGAFASAFWPGIEKWYGLGYAEHAKEYDKLVDIRSSIKQFEELVGSSWFGQAPVVEDGAPYTYATAKQGFKTRATHVQYGLGFILTQIMVEDNLYAELAPKFARALAFSMRQTKETVVANLYNNGFDGAFTFGDGQPMLSSAHPNVAGGTWSNILATAADLSEASLEQACIDIMKLETDEGHKMAIMPQTLHIAPDEVFNAERILKSTYRVGTSDNDINALNNLGKFRGGVHVNHYFTDPDAWFIRTNCPDGPVMYERIKEEFDEDGDFDTNNYKYKARMRFSVTSADPRGIFGSAGA